MVSELPNYYFRIRENGALVFRVSMEARRRRIDMDQIAVVNLRRGEVKPQGEHALSDADHAAIRDWMEARGALLAARETDDVLRTVDQINHTAHWAQSRASDDQLDSVTDALLLAMHDLRSVLVRKKADRLGSG